MKNKKDITKITFLTCLLIGNMVCAQNFYTCMPKKSWIINVVKEEQEAERRRREEEKRKKRKRAICLEKKDACESRKVCYEDCFKKYYMKGIDEKFVLVIVSICEEKCDYKKNEDCGTCP